MFFISTKGNPLVRINFQSILKLFLFTSNVGLPLQKMKRIQEKIAYTALYNVSRTHESAISIIIEYQISNWERNARLGDVKLNML